jgi:hypothetical protein
MEPRYTLPFSKPWITPPHLQQTRAVEFALAALSFMPGLRHSAILAYAQQEERHGGLMLDLSLSQLLGHLQQYLADRDA